MKIFLNVVGLLAILGAVGAALEARSVQEGALSFFSVVSAGVLFALAKLIGLLEQSAKKRDEIEARMKGDAVNVRAFLADAREWLEKDKLKT